MVGLTILHLIHKTIGPVSLATDEAARECGEEYWPRNRLDQFCRWTTIIPCLTGFWLFRHDNCGKPTAVEVLTLLVLGTAAVIDCAGLFGPAYVVTLGYSPTFLFHLIPFITETFTRLPAAQPVFSSVEDPTLQSGIGGVFLLFLVGTTLQVLRLRGGHRTARSARLV